MSKLVPKSQATSEVATLLQSPAMLAQLRLAMPKHITPERLARIVLTEIRRTPQLLQCSRESLLGSILQAATLGLEPGVLGQCWILPYRGVATFIPGYRGMAQLAWRSNQVASIAARAVFEGDHFVCDFGTDQLEHRPGGGTDPQRITHVWASIGIKGGGRVWDVMTREEVESVRARSAAGGRGPWQTDYAEMAKKTVLKRLMKIAPCSVEMQQALQLDDAAERGITQGIEFEVPELSEVADGTEQTAPAEQAS